MDDLIKNAEKFIAGHLQEEFTLDEIADFCGYSPSYFARKFKETVNKTVMGYVREKRIFAAAELIKNGSGICDAAMECGFETHAGFTKAFHAVFGCCPRDYTAHCCGDYWKGFLFDNNYVMTGDGRDELMKELIVEMKVRCKEMGISTLISPQEAESDSARAFVAMGFKEAWTSGGWTYLAMSV